MMALLDGRLHYTRSKSLNHTFKMMALLDGRLRYTLKIVKSHFKNDIALLDGRLCYIRSKSLNHTFSTIFNCVLHKTLHSLKAPGRILPDKD